jgi:flagellar biosynthetic protein FlhB
MAASDQDRTERATPKRKRDARKRGQVPRSRELSAAGEIGAAALAMVASGPHIANGAADLMRQLLSFDATALADPWALPRLFGHACMQGMMLCVPIFGACVVAALVAPALMGGWNFSAQALRFDFSRLNPASGLGRMFSSQGAVELLKGLAKLAWIGGIGGLYLWKHHAALVGLSAEPSAAGITDGAALVFGAGTWLALAMIAVAGIDVPYQLWSYAKNLRMSRQEIRDEMKQSEGRPEVKAKVRRLQYEISKRRMMQKIPAADVVVTNPTHYAVALKYSSEDMRAPRVVAKGSGEIAAVIRELAREHRVPLVSAPPLARALYRGVNLDQEIPAGLYAAVARVLTYVYQLRAWRGGTPPPMLPQIGDVPGGEADPEVQGIGRAADIAATGAGFRPRA